MIQLIILYSIQINLFSVSIIITSHLLGQRIQFEEMNFNKFLQSYEGENNNRKLVNNYVKGNMEVFEKSFKLLPEFERPIYCFDGEDNNQRIAHIQYDKKWIIEPEKAWQEKSISGQDETNEEDNYLLPNCV